MVATYSGRAGAAVDEGAADRAGAADAVAIRIETTRVDRWSRRTSFSVPFGSTPLVGVVLAGGALAFHRATQAGPEVHAFFIGVDREPVRGIVLVIGRDVHALLEQEHLGTERRASLLSGLHPFERGRELRTEPTVVGRYRRITAVACEPQLRLRVLGLRVRVSRSQLRLLETLLELADLGMERRDAAVVRRNRGRRVLGRKGIGSLGGQPCGLLRTRERLLRLRDGRLELRGAAGRLLQLPLEGRDPL